MPDNQQLIEAARADCVEALEYLGYSVGHYGRHRAGGITLQFRSLLDGGDRYAIFNCETRRARTTKGSKKGDPLPPGQFRVGKRSAFYKFWLTTGLPFHRLSDFHDFMGNLRGLVFTANIASGERLDATTLCPLDLPDSIPTTSRQAPDNIPTRIPDKETPQPQQPRAIQPNQTTGEINHGTRSQGYAGIRGNHSPQREYRGKSENCLACSGEGCQWCKRKPPQEQSNAEWLADFMG